MTSARQLYAQCANWQEPLLPLQDPVNVLPKRCVNHRTEDKHEAKPRDRPGAPLRLFEHYCHDGGNVNYARKLLASGLHCRRRGYRAKWITMATAAAAGEAVSSSLQQRYNHWTQTRHRTSVDLKGKGRCRLWSQSLLDIKQWWTLVIAWGFAAHQWAR